MAANNPRNGATKLRAVTPHDTNELNPACRALYIGGAGDVTVIALEDSLPITFKNVPAGAILPAFTKVVKATGTTATLIVAMA